MLSSWLLLAVATNEVYTVKENQGEKGPFNLGQGESGKLEMVGGSIFILVGQRKISFLIIIEVFRVFCLYSKFILSMQYLQLYHFINPTKTLNSCIYSH